MGLLTKETMAAIRRGAWCNDTRIPACHRQPKPDPSWRKPLAQHPHQPQPQPQPFT